MNHSSRLGSNTDSCARYIVNSSNVAASCFGEYHGLRIRGVILDIVVGGMAHALCQHICSEDDSSAEESSDQLMAEIVDSDLPHKEC